MEKNTLLKIIHQAIFPFAHGSLHDGRQRLVGQCRDYPGIGFGRRDGDWGLHQEKRVSLQREVDRRQTIADTLGQHRSVVDEERAVGSELRRTCRQLIVIGRERKQPTQEQQHRRGIGRTASQPGTKRYDLVKIGFDGRYRITSGKNAISLDDQIVFCPAVDSKPRKVQIATRFPVCRGNDFESVASPHGIEYGCYVVILVGTSGQDVQPKIYLGIGKE